MLYGEEEVFQNRVVIQLPMILVGFESTPFHVKIHEKSKTIRIRRMFAECVLSTVVRRFVTIGRVFENIISHGIEEPIVVFGGHIQLGIA